MAGKLSFSIAINLLTENFKRGTNSVKNGLRAMQMQVLTFAAALGAGGLGLSGFVSQLITVARETSRVTTALKNVSGGMGQFADNQRFVIDMAKKYGLEVNALTGNFAKFTAASNVSGMSMQDQRKIFESVSRACTAFGMSADDSNGVFLALSQMMSKGKISSEELRLQMGERLPIALQAMAKAAGVPISELDKLMKQGKLMSADVLPGFADALNEMIPNVDTDNLETSVNRLKNAFTEFTKGTNIQSAYKGAIDWLSGAVKTAGENIKNIVIGVAAVVAGIVTKSAQGMYRGLNSIRKAANDKILNDAKNLQAQASKIFDNLSEVQARRERSLARMQDSGGRYNSLVAKRDIQTNDLDVLKSKYLALQSAESSNVVEVEKARKAYLKKSQTIEKVNLQIDNSKNAYSRASQEYEKTGIKVVKLTNEYVGAKKAAIEAGEAVDSISKQSTASKVFDNLRIGVEKVKLALKGLWASFGPALIVAGAIAIIGKFKAMYDEAKRIKNIFSDYKKESQISGYTQEVVALKQQLKIMNDKKQGQENINNAQAELQKMLGKEYKSQKEINEAVAKRVDLLKETARADFHARKQVEFEDKNKTLASSVGLSSSQAERLALLSVGKDTSKQNKDYYYQLMGQMYRDNGVIGKYDASAADDAIKEYAQNMRVIADSSAELEKSTVAANKILGTTKLPGGGDPDDKKSALQEAEEKHARSVRELDAKAEVEKLSKNEYNKALDELNRKMLIEAKASGDKDILNSEYIKMLEDVIDKPLYNETQAKLEEVQKEYTDAINLAKLKQEKGLLSQQEYSDAITDAAVSAANSAIAIDGIKDAANGFIKKVQDDAIAEIKAPVLGKRDTTFDYRASDSDKISGELDVWKDYRDELKDLKSKHRGLSEDLEKKLNAAIANVDNLEDALKLSEVKEDIKQFSKEFNESLYGGIQGVVSLADRMVSSFKRLEEVFDPKTQAEGWEKFMAVWEAINSVINETASLIKTFENVSGLVAKLAGAKDSQESLKESAVSTAASSLIQIGTAQAATALELASSKKKTEAATTEMAAKSTAAYANIPFVGLGLAAGQITAMMGLITGAASTLPTFANGGIVVNGPTSGDRVLARVNAGEMILNHGQQSRLFEAINSGTLGGNQSINIGFDRVRGPDILLALNNTLKRQGKKPL